MQIAVIDFGTSKIVSAVANTGIDKADIRGSGSVAYAGFGPDGWNEPEKVSEAVASCISAAELEAKTQVTELYVGVPGAFTHVVTGEAEIETGESGVVTEEDVEKIQDKVAEKLHLENSGYYILHRAPAWFSVDDGKQNMTPVNKRGSRLRAQVSFIMAAEDFIEDMREFLSSLGYAVKGFFSPMYGLGMLSIAIKDRDNPNVMIDVGFLHTEIMVFQGDACVYHALLDDQGSGYMDGALMEAFQLTMDEAEQIKRAYIFNHDDEFDPAEYKAYDEEGKCISIPHRQVKRALDPYLGDLFTTLKVIYENDLRGMMFNRSEIYLTGGGLAPMRGGREKLRDTFGRPVKNLVLHSNKLKGPMYHSTQGLIDVVMSAVETDDTVEGGFRQLIGGLFGRFGKSGK